MPWRAIVNPHKSKYLTHQTPLSNCKSQSHTYIHTHQHNSQQLTRKTTCLFLDPIIRHARQLHAHQRATIMRAKSGSRKNMSKSRTELSTRKKKLPKKQIKESEQDDDGPLEETTPEHEQTDSDIIGAILSEAWRTTANTIQSFICSPCETHFSQVDSMSSSYTPSVTKRRQPIDLATSINEHEVLAQEMFLDGPISDQNGGKVSCLMEAPDMERRDVSSSLGECSGRFFVQSLKTMTETDCENETVAKSIKKTSEKRLLRTFSNEFGMIKTKSKRPVLKVPKFPDPEVKLLTPSETETTFNTTESSELQSKGSHRDITNFDRGFRIQWAIKKNVLPGLDRWKGVLRNTASSISNKSNGDRNIDESAPLGLVQGFWIRRHPQNNADTRLVHHRGDQQRLWMSWICTRLMRL